MAEYGTCTRCGTTVKLTGHNIHEDYGRCPVCGNKVIKRK